MIESRPERLNTYDARNKKMTLNQVDYLLKQI